MKAFRMWDNEETGVPIQACDELALVFHLLRKLEVQFEPMVKGGTAEGEFEAAVASGEGEAQAPLFTLMKFTEVRDAVEVTKLVQAAFEWQPTNRKNRRRVEAQPYARKLLPWLEWAVRKARGQVVVE
jgi:hypothetical protein